MINNTKLTIIVPLYERDYYTKIWTAANLNNQYSYYFPDGSNSDENRKIFKSLNLNNVKYQRYKPDNTAKDFIDKMYYASEKVETKYVMTSDNDDFINYNGVDACISFLENNKKYNCASGFICSINSSKITNKYKIFPRYNYGMINLSDCEPIDGLKNYLDSSIKSSYLWYSIYRTEYFQKIWKDIKNSKINDLGIVELLQTSLTIKYCKYKCLYNNHYIRLRNPSESNASKKKNLSQRLEESKHVRNDLVKFSFILKDKFKIDEITINKLFLNYQKKINNNSDKSYFLFFRIFVRIINLSEFKINTIKKILNLFIKLKY